MNIGPGLRVPVSVDFRQSNFNKLWGKFFRGDLRKLFDKIAIKLASCYCTKLLFAPNINDIIIKCASVVQFSAIVAAKCKLRKTVGRHKLIIIIFGYCK